MCKSYLIKQIISTQLSWILFSSLPLISKNIYDLDKKNENIIDVKSEKENIYIET